MFLAIIENLAPDDQEFFLDIYEQFKRIMFHTARKYVSDLSSAEDLVQDAIVKLIPKVSTMRQLSRCALSAYIVITVRNTAINHLRRQQVVNRQVVNSDFEKEIDLERSRYLPSPEDILLISERKNDFHKIWATLPEKDRDVLMGKYVLGLNDHELAELYGCKPSSIRMVLTRARRRALEKMKGEALNYEA